MSTVVEWRTASPLWKLALKDTRPATRLRQPCLLRFAGDDFMERIQSLLQESPTDLKDYVMADEDWLREVEEPERVVGWREEGDEPVSTPKLYQPIHGRFYLMAANLVCRQQGLPDHKVDLANGEKVSAVVRRLVPVTDPQEGGKVDLNNPASYTEQAWQSEGEQGSWISAEADALVSKEEQLPLFPLNFEQSGQPRRLWLALVPAQTRQTQAIENADDGEWPDTGDNPDPRMNWFDSKVGQTFAQVQASTSGDDPALDTLATAGGNSAPIIELTRFWLLDLAEYLAEHTPNVWAGIASGSLDADVTDEEANIYNLLSDATLSNGADNPLLFDALKAVEAQRTVLLETGAPESEADLVYDLSTLLLQVNPAEGVEDTDTLRGLLEDWFATDAAGKAKLPKVADLPVAARQDAPSESEPGDGAVYVTRCVYQRPQCAGQEAQLLSAPSPGFQYADFFDTDAPARALQIRMPSDTGIGQLRRFKRGVSIAVSSKLRNQMERIRGVTMGKVDEGKLGKPASFDFGMVCSLSIPIITIVALILLMIMVQLLNIIFWWLPFLKVCLPIPKKS